MLERVKRPDGTEISFEYDALGRRTAKINEATKEITRFVWDGNVPLHEWKYALENRPQIVANELGELSLDKKEPTENLITWIFDEGSFVPSAKITKDDTFSIVSDYIGKPIAAYNGVGNLVWDVEYDIYGNIRSQSKGDKDFIPFRNQGQYEDSELNGLMYNRFRYYDGNSGTYISQDPIRLLGGKKLYSYVYNSNALIDAMGLAQFLPEGAELVDFPKDLLFGQKRIAPQFSSMSGVDNPLIEGRTLKDVARDLADDNVALHADDFMIRFVELPNGQKVTLNNRGLAVLEMSGKTPSMAIKVPLSSANPKLLADIGQKGFAGEIVPSRKIAVTIQKDGGGHLYDVSKACRNS